MNNNLASGHLHQKEVNHLVRAISAMGLLPIVLVVIVAALSIFEPRFLGIFNILNVLRETSFLAILAAGQMLVLIVGGFDLSVGAVVALSSTVTATVMAYLLGIMPDDIGLVIFIGVAAGIGCGVAVGLVNGLCVAFLRVSPFMVTLGTLSIASGIALLLTNGIPVYGMPKVFVKSFGRALWLGLPTTVYVALALVIIVWVIQRYTVLGRYIYAIGGNLQASLVSGVSTKTYLVMAYTMCGALAAITGVLLTARVGSGQATLGGNIIMLQSIAAAVIAGVSLRGGIGRVELVTLGALFLSIVTNGMNLVRIDSKIQTIVLGVIVIIAVALEEYGNRRKIRE
ncbi:MAG: ABC transporter permease [Sneathiella sp.]|uniref:ABC transporter permease n=1 Tax=Sneathiella sp. TaxID=1964365 RepID=UPI003001EEBF